MNDYKEKNIAVVGVSRKIEKYGYRIFTDLLKAGYNVFGVNPKAGKIQGETIYPSLKDIKPLPDLVVTAVKPEITEKIVEEMHKLELKRIWMQPGSESDKAVKKARDYGILATSKKCFMAANGLWKKKDEEEWISE